MYSFYFTNPSESNLNKQFDLIFFLRIKDVCPFLVFNTSTCHGIHPIIIWRIARFQYLIRAICKPRYRNVNIVWL